MQGDRPCPRCGQLIPIGHEECPHCAVPRGWWTVERETLLLLSLAALAVLFTITGIAANLYHSKKQTLGQQWFAEGERALQGGQAGQALMDFRTALAYSPDTSIYRLRLAQALVAANRSEEARSHLLTLWRDEPGDGTVNLELARLAARQGDTSDALRYFHNAIYGVWPTDPVMQRIQTRFELSEYLLEKNQKAQAQSELIALAAVLPQDPGLYMKVAGMFRSAGDRNRALGAYRQALALDRHEHAALAGAGETAFEIGDYAAAVNYLDRAVRLRAASDADREELATARLVLSLDPLAPRLSRAAADQRTLHAFEFATGRLSDCLRSRGLNPKPGLPASAAPAGQPQDDLERLALEAEKFTPDAKLAALRQNPDLRVNLMDFVSAIEEATAKECGTPSGADLALLLIARKHGASEQ